MTRWILFACIVLLSSSVLCDALLHRLPSTRCHPHLSSQTSILQQAISKDDEERDPIVLFGPTVQPPRPNDNTYWIIPNGFIAGEYPGDNRGEVETREKLQRYLDLNITTFIDLTRPGEKSDYESLLKEEAAKKGLLIEYRRFPITDFGIPSKKEVMKHILDEIDAAVKERNQIAYVHCRGGIGRTGTAVGCYLVRHGHSGNGALEELNRLFQSSGRSYESPLSPETNEQRQLVKEWEE